MEISIGLISLYVALFYIEMVVGIVIPNVWQRGKVGLFLGCNLAPFCLQHVISLSFQANPKPASSAKANLYLLCPK